MAVRIVLGDDADVVRIALRRFLESDPRVDLVADACGADETIAALIAFRPDVVVFDLRMSMRKGDRCEAFRQASEGMGRVAISVSVDADAHRLAGKCGADYLVDKLNLSDDLIRAIVRSADRRPDVSVK